MRIACVAFTQEGVSLARRVAESLARQEDEVSLCAPSRLAKTANEMQGALRVDELDSLQAWTARAFERSDALLFVCACGIAVRAISPYVHSKFSDPAVVCVDESASFVIPLLSGHVGGANQLARRIADHVGAQAAITTATDVRGVFSVDEWAAEQDLSILDCTVAKEISAALLEGRTVGLSSEFAIDGTPPAGIQVDDKDACELGISVSLDPTRKPFARTLRLVPRTVTVGVGCKRNTPYESIARQVDECLERAHVAAQAVCAIASIEAKANEQGLLELAEQRGWQAHFYSAAELAAVEGTFSSSDFVRKTVGVDNVCERAACANGSTLLTAKCANDGVTVALAYATPTLRFPQFDDTTVEHEPAPRVRSGPRGGLESKPREFAKCLGRTGRDELRARSSRSAVRARGVSPVPSARGGTGLFEHGAFPHPRKDLDVLRGREQGDETTPTRPTSVLRCVGLGPGAGADLTERAREALGTADLIVGYTTYVDLVRDQFPSTEFLSTPMRMETERCEEALRQAASGRRVALVCSGDPGVYGMAGLVLELAQRYPQVQVEIVPGVTAACGGAALLGAPLIHDWCCISLSDLMTPWEDIEARLRAAAQSGMCLCLYNPGSHGRADHLRKACDVLLESCNPQTICGIARNVGRPAQCSQTLTLEELRTTKVDMSCCVFVGNERTRLVGGRMVTPRGYAREEA